MLRNYRKTFALMCFFSSILLLSLFNNTNISYAQFNGDSHTIHSDIEFFEYSEIKGRNVNSSSIDIQLTEPNWTVTDIKINISEINLGSEIKTIEDTETGLEQVWNKNSIFRTFALGTQLEILEVTDLFGVYIKGYKTQQATEIIKFQIQGFDEGNNSPNNTIYRSIYLNISTDLDWYYQNFSANPIRLSIGNYSLVMNGTNLLPDADAKYFWQKDDLDPQIPHLYKSSYITSWDAGIVNSSFLCKLHQSVDESFLPTDLNMTVEFAGNSYSIPDSGILEIANITYFLEESNLVFPLIINKSATLSFNYNYSINVKSEFSTTSSSSIKESNIQWLSSLIISRITENYYVSFNIPRNWYNITIFRRISSTWENVTSIININLNNRKITFPNNTIIDNSEWRIIAYSPMIDLGMNFPNLEWNPGQELQFAVNLPFVDGNLTFNLINPLGFSLEEPILKEVVSEETFFTYLIPSNSIEGTYIARIIWNNATDIGIQSQEFQITIPPIPFTIDPIWIILSVLITVGVSVLAIFSYVTIKKNRIKRAEEAQKLFNKCMDVLNLEYLIVSDKKSGLNMYQQNFSGKKIEAAMISGFLQAIHSFGIELIKIEDQSQTIKLEYKDSIILMTEFVNLRLILILKESPSPNFLYSLEDLAYEIHNSYGDLIENFNGNIKPFYSIEKLLKQYLNISLTYPLRLAKINMVNGTKFNVAERMLIGKAMSFMKSYNTDYFYLSSLLPEKACTPKDIENILNLIERNIFQLKEKIELK